MNYSIETIEGIGATYGQTLKDAGITNTKGLLEKCGTRAGRAKTSKETGLSEALLLKWTNMADLMRISGVGEEYSELLEAAGVDTIKELRNRNPETLTAMMEETNKSKKLTRLTPKQSQVEKWVTEAKTLKPVISH